MWQVKHSCTNFAQAARGKQSYNFATYQKNESLHCNKFHVLFPLARKSAAEVGLNLQNLVFSYLGTPRILHSDNGREFVNEIVSDVAKSWPGKVTI